MTTLIQELRADRSWLVIAPPEDSRTCAVCKRVCGFLVCRLESTGNVLRCIPCDEKVRA